MDDRSQWADYYLLVTRSRPLEGFEHPPLGFLLMPVQVTPEWIETTDGWRLEFEERQRFLYPRDVERVVNRGLGTRDVGVVSGSRLASLAAFPQLRRRNLVMGRGAPENTAVAASEPTPVVGTPGDSVGLSDAIPDEDVDPKQLDRGDDGEPADIPVGDDLHPDMPVLHDPTSSEVLDANRELDEPEVAKPSEGSTLDAPLALLAAEQDEALQQALRDIRLRISPSRQGLATLALVPSALDEILELSTVLPPDEQLNLGARAIDALMAEEGARAWMNDCLATIAGRLHSRSDKLTDLLEYWASADAAKACATMLQKMDVGVLNLTQQKPTEVATTLRNLASMTGSEETLEMAYTAMAQAPHRRRKPAELERLLSELDQEDVLTDGARMAIGSPIILQAYGHATDDDLLMLALTAETYIRAMVRQQPPNVADASRLRQVLEAAHPAADQGQRASIEDCLRELSAATGGLSEQLGQIPDVVVDYVGALRAVDGRTPNVLIVETAYETAAVWARDGTKHVPAVVQTLASVCEVADLYAAKGIDDSGLTGAFGDRGQQLVRDQSETAKTHAKTRRFHVVKDSEGNEYQIGPHFKYGRDRRMYLAIDKPRRRLVVARLGDHLPGDKSKNRPRK